MIFASLFLLFAIPLAWIDFKYYILPDVLTFSMLWSGLLINSFYQVFCPIKLAILGVVIGYLSLYIVYWVYYFFTHKEGIGFGDFKLFASLGAWFGVFSLPNILLIGSVSGLIFVMFKNIINKNKSKNKSRNIDNGEKIIKDDVLNINPDPDPGPDPDINYIAFGPFLLLGAGAYLLIYIT
jgi:general secretion pathway protein O